MCFRSRWKSVAALAAAQVLIGAAAWPSLGAGRAARIIETPPRSNNSLTNLRESLSPEFYFPDKSLTPLKPEINHPAEFIAPPPRPMPPSRRVLEMMEEKKNWALADPSKALGIVTSKDLLPTDQDAARISGTTQGFIERYRKNLEKENSDQVEAMNEAIRKLREEDGSGWDPVFLQQEEINLLTESLRPAKSSQHEFFRSVNDAHQYQPANPSLLDNYSIRSLQQEQLSPRGQTYREFLDTQLTRKPAEPAAARVETALQPELPPGAIADLSIRPLYSSSNPNTAFSPFKPAVDPFAPFGNPAALRSDLKVDAGNSARPTAPVIQPFGPLPQRNF